VLPFGQHQRLVEQLDLDHRGLHAAGLPVHLHRNGPLGDDPGLPALADASAVHPRLQHGQLVGGQSDHLHQAVVDRGLRGAKGVVPRVGAAAIAAGIIGKIWVI